MPSTLKWINVALRALMELGIVVALGYWGCKTGSGTGAKILLGIGALSILHHALVYLLGGTLLK